MGHKINRCNIHISCNFLFQRATTSAEIIESEKKTQTRSQTSEDTTINQISKTVWKHVI